MFARGSNVYVGTSGGVSISTNGGATFTNYTTGLGSTSVQGIYVDTVGTIYAATMSGLSISTDGGSTFTNYTTAEGLGSDFTYAVAASGDTIYVGSSGGLSISFSPASATPIPMWQQAIARASGTETCPEDYTPSWAQWPNNGTGGYVCNKFVPMYGN